MTTINSLKIVKACADLINFRHTEHSVLKFASYCGVLPGAKTVRGFHHLLGKQLQATEHIYPKPREGRNNWSSTLHGTE